MAKHTEHQVPVAIVGVSAIFPGSNEAGGFWRDVVSGRDLITDVPPTHWLIEDYYDPDPTAPDKTYCKRGAFLGDIPFDTLGFGIPPNNLSATDTSQLLALLAARQVLADLTAGRELALDRDRVSVILGVTSGQTLGGTLMARLQRPVWQKAMREAGLSEDRVQDACDRIAEHYVPWQEASFPGALGNVIAGRIANRFDLHGTNCVTDAACASALSAIAVAAGELALGQADLAISGGVDAANDIFTYMCFSKTPALSMTGDCRPFSDAADGTMLGEGMALFALKRLADAERDGDHIYAVIRGIGSSSDGRAKSIYAPLPEGQARALKRAYVAAGYSPRTVELVEAHGTGTRAGDAAEFSGLSQVFSEVADGEHQWCALGSIKSQIGHTKAAAGAAGLFKAVMALNHKLLPPTLKVERPNPALNLQESPFYLSTEARPWIRGADHPRRASVSSFGFGGSNYHVTLEEYRPPEGAAAQPRRMDASPAELILLSAADPTALLARCEALASEEGALGDVARASHKAFDAGHPARLAIVAATAEELRERLAQAIKGLSARPTEALSSPAGIYYRHGAPEGEVALVFPGQGSQAVGMGGELAMAFDLARAPWDAIADRRFDGASLQEVVFPRPAFTAADRQEQRAHLTRTEWAQPALGVASAAMLGVLRAVGVDARMAAGHSFGELTALYAAGALDLDQLVALARRRGELMRDAASVPGGMLAVSGPAHELEALRGRLGEGVGVANLNSPTQIVLSGGLAEIEAAEAELARISGLRVQRLEVATAFHSPLVAGSSAPFLESLAQVGFAAPSFDVLASADGEPYPAEAAAIRQRLADQIAQPVRFVDQIEALYERGARLFVEVGPGSVLTNLVGEILKGRPHEAIPMDRRGRHGVVSLQHALGRLAAAGIPLDLSALWPEIAVTPESAITERKGPSLLVPIRGSNYGVPYPPQTPAQAGASPAARPPAAGASSPAPVAAKPVNGEARRSAAAAPPRPVAGGAPVGSPSAPPPRPASPVLGAGGQAAAPVAVSAPVLATRSAPPAPRAPEPPQPVAASLPGEALHAWLRVYSDMQQRTLEAHLAHQAAMAEGHASFMRASEVGVARFGEILSAMAGAPQPRGAGAYGQIPSSPTWAPVPEGSPSQSVVTVASRPAEPALERPPLAAAPRDTRPAAVGGGNGISGAPPVATASAPIPEAAPLDLQALMLSIVAEKTGYPVEMLGLQMELEADLGIDSIKRVEILSALREAVPALPEVKASELAGLRTLGQIVDYMDAHGLASPANGAAGAKAPAAPGGANGAAKSAPAAAPAVDLQALMLAVVAEKTGYPAEMLGLHMELEADLGIDSIKRVEILSALRDRIPDLPEVKASELAGLRTLGQIVEYMDAHGLSGGAAAAPQAAAPAPASSAAQGGASSPAEVALPLADAPLNRYAVRAAAAEAPGQPASGLSAEGRFVVAEDGQGIAAEVVAQLARRGVEAEVVSQVPGDAARVLFLGGLRPVATAEEAIALNEEAFEAARAVGSRLESQGGLFVTVQDTGGDFGLSGAAPTRAWLGGISALARTAHLEWPDATVRAIDLEVGGRSPAAVARALVDELLQGGDTLEVGLHADGRRTILETYPSSSGGDGALDLPAGAVVVASGGARGVTAQTLIALARAHRPRIVLLGRTPIVEEPAHLADIPDEAGLKRALFADAKARGEEIRAADIGATTAQLLTSREVRATLRSLEEAGSEVRYFTVDVRDEAALSDALGAVRAEWGPISGIIHGAGVLADRLIVEKTPEQFKRVFETKVLGLRALLAATAADPLAFLFLFSSVVARTGNPGQSDYAMANEVMNLVACAERARRGCLVRSLGWGPWAGGMVTPLLQARFEKVGVELISLQAGAAALVAELGGAQDETVILLGSAPDRDGLGAMSI